ncbi:uncharacterized protein JCM6883_001489 [Sporobolomyces salmoneus]|uniref:uncharacterized protein n=1 Tax=Sporobolomyces salmoneus TaxID=183962 RepID=UPI003177EC01
MAMSTPKNIDHLSQLPPELLEDIFDRVQHSSTPLVDPLSRSLFPFQQKPLFESLYVRSYEDLETFCDYIQNRPQLAAYTREFGVSIVPHERSRELDCEIEDPQSPSNERVKELFKCLVQVTDMAIAGTDRIARLVLESDVAATSFPNLRTLRLSSTFISLRDPFHPASYRSLQHYHELHGFILVVRRSSDSIELTTSNDQIQPVPIHTKIDKIGLSGPLSATPTSVNQLINIFVPLHAIYLRDTSTGSRLYDFLDHVHGPNLIRALSLNRLMTSGPPSRGSLIEKLKNFPNLLELELGGTVSSVSPSLYTSLRSLPLPRRLAFSQHASVSLEELAKLISGPQKLKSLKSILFNNVRGIIGTRVREMGPCWIEDMREYGPHPDWILPDWSSEFSGEGLFDFLEDAVREGVKIEGSAVRAIGVTQEWEEEAKEARNYYTKKFIESELCACDRCYDL